MKSVWMAEPAKLEIREIPVPEISPEEVLLKVEYAGICGSDLHIYHNTHSFRFPPVIVGHEVAGTIVKVGSHVERLKVGDRVAVLPCTPAAPASGSKKICRPTARNAICRGRTPGSAPVWSI